MKINFKQAIIFLLALAVSAFAQAATKPADDNNAPSADEIISKYIQAVGGKEALEKITSRTAKGTFEISSLKIVSPLEIYAKSPNLVALKIDVPGVGLIEQGFNGKVAWATDPQ